MRTEKEQKGENPCPPPQEPSNQHYFSKTLRNKSNFVVSVIYTVRPRQGEQYYLHLLLHHLKCAPFLKDMRNFDEEECVSFKELCRQKRLSIDDTDWKNALQKGFCSNTVPVTKLYAGMLIHCSLSNPWNTYNKKIDVIFQDFHHRIEKNSTRL